VTDVEVSDDVRAKVEALGEEGERWLRSLPDLVDELAEEWGLEVGAPVGAGGSAGYLVHVVARSDGDRPAVLKLAIPDGLRGNGSFADGLAALLAAGPGMVEVLRSDVERRAVLLERLGRPLADLGLPVEEQVDVIAAALARVWQPLPVGAPFERGAAKAAALVTFIEDLWRELGQPCPRAVVDHAIAAADRRRAALEAAGPSSLVFVHGDAHEANVLEDGAGGFKLIDPDGLASEPAHDLGVTLRGWNAEALVTPDPAATVLGWCERAAARTGVDLAAITDWATVERVSTGLFLLQLGHEEEGGAFLRVADLLASPS
jgi:streptomycin 6-kinase